MYSYTIVLFHVYTAVSKNFSDEFVLPLISASEYLQLFSWLSRCISTLHSLTNRVHSGVDGKQHSFWTKYWAIQGSKMLLHTVIQETLTT